jgi:hypothetical protein
LCNYGNKILIFPFSEGTMKKIIFDDEKRNLLFNKTKDLFVRYNTDKELTFVCADANTETLIDQIKNNDILYFCG